MGRLATAERQYSEAIEGASHEQRLIAQRMRAVRMGDAPPPPPHDSHDAVPDSGGDVFTGGANPPRVCVCGSVCVSGMCVCVCLCCVCVCLCCVCVCSVCVRESEWLWWTAEVVWVRPVCFSFFFLVY